MRKVRVLCLFGAYDPPEYRLYVAWWRSGQCVGLAPLNVTTLGNLFTHSVLLFTKQYKLVLAIGWEGNRRSGVALAMRHRLSGLSTYRLNGLGKGDEHPA